MVTTVTKNPFFFFSFFFETVAPKPRMDSAAPVAGTKDNTHYIRSPRAPSHPPHLGQLVGYRPHGNWQPRLG